MRSEDECIDELGGTAAVAAALALPLSTVSTWRERGIPPARWASLVRLGDALGKTVSFEALAALRAQRVGEISA